MGRLSKAQRDVFVGCEFRRAAADGAERHACRHSLFVFLANRAVPPTNNGSEPALWPCVAFRKVTNCFPSEWAAHLYADIRSVIETARRRAIGVLDAIRNPERIAIQPHYPASSVILFSEDRAVLRRFVAAGGSA